MSHGLLYLKNYYLIRIYKTEGAVCPSLELAISSSCRYTGLHTRSLASCITEIKIIRDGLYRHLCQKITIY